MSSRKICLILSVAVFLVIPFSVIASEEDYPKRPIEVVLNYPPGGSLDNVMRIIQPALQAKLGVPVILTTKAGGAGALGADFVAKANPDGYTIGAFSYVALTSSPQFNKSIPYKYTDFIPLGTITADPCLLVSKPEAPWRTFEELVSYAKKNPGKLNYGSPGMGGTGFSVMELIKIAYDIDIVPVHFQGAGPAKIAILGGHVNMAIGGYGAFIPLIKAGSLTGLVLTSLNRSPIFPTIPTMAEKGLPEASLMVRNGLLVPQKCSKAVVKKLEKALLELMRDPAIISQIEKAGLIPEDLDSEATWKVLEEEFKAVNKVVKKLGI